MPKRVGHLYEKMCDKDLIREAIRKLGRLTGTRSKMW